MAMPRFAQSPEGVFGGDMVGIFILIAEALILIIDSFNPGKTSREESYLSDMPKFLSVMILLDDLRYSFPRFLG
uniref:Uncharacterized protein n=1 Tax=Candidatus Kentrum sp. MB TaxID=2138164 RepID=A0A451BAV1_9GAMM|nr:MAG: hypothetical protein BECKMB1821G_GA0114241_102447 [Candidatus Kentron sp. MB]VFK31241.1 MAG: hypothetical protein BECKMB1821I_GA0114274_102146 [Candidatus Kentron sp. MB]VFK75413.1 MAG: hypothetical protein BECKMB1821H_GA0114242_102147 [Candidatus Kentron sp. MB]